MKKLGYLMAVMGVLWSTVGLAQNDPPMYNPNSVSPIAEYEHFYKKRVWRRMDLKEKQNRSFFAYSKEITRLIIDAVDRGELQPYKNNDSLNVRISKDDFFELLEVEDYSGGADTDDLGLGDDSGSSGWGGDDSGSSGWGGDDSGSSGWGGDQASTESAEPSADYYGPVDVSILEIMEDIIFDKRRSRIYYDIQSVKLILPAEMFQTGIYREVATFKYKDLEALFRKYPMEAVWFNPQNSAEHKNFADAFSLRLHDAHLIKIQNTDDNQIIDIYNGDPKKALLASQQLEYELMEFEHNLWEQ